MKSPSAHFPPSRHLTLSRRTDHVIARPCVARQTLSARHNLGWQGRQFRALFCSCRKGRTVLVRLFWPARDREAGVAGKHRPDLAWLRTWAVAGYLIWLPGVWTLRTADRPPFQPPQTAARPLCQAVLRLVEPARRALWLPGRPLERRSILRYPRQCPRHAEVRGGGHQF